MNENIRSAFFSANLHHFLPKIPWTAHPEYYQNYCQLHSGRKILLPQTLPKMDLGLGRPGLLVAFHLGDHALLPGWLAAAGVPFDILLSQDTYQRYEAPLDKAKAAAQVPASGDLRYLLSEDPKLFYQIRRTLAEGRHLLVFADGNGGLLSGSAKAAHLLPVPFFDGQLWVRKGIGFLAAMLGVPIYPLCNEASPGEVCLKPVVPLLVDAHADRQAAIQRMMTELFAVLQKRIADQPMLWECWAYLHRNGMLQTEALPAVGMEDLDLSAAHVVPLEGKDGQRYWLDKSTYRMFIAQ